MGDRQGEHDADAVAKSVGRLPRCLGTRQRRQGGRSRLQRRSQLQGCVRLLCPASVPVTVDGRHLARSHPPVGAAKAGAGARTETGPVHLAMGGRVETADMRVSLLTAVHPPSSTHLAATATSVAAARRTLAGAGHDLEWVVAIDGPGEVPPIDAAPGVRVLRRPMNGGASAARNTALAASSGEMVMPLDHDDLIDADGLLRVLADPMALGSAWVAGNAQLLDGSFTAHRVVEARLFGPRQLEEHWSSPFPFHPNIVLARRDAALAAGGWPALSANQDLGYVFSLNRAHAGWAVPCTLIRYRTWEAQTVAQSYYSELKSLDFAFLLSTLNAERAAAGLGPITAPVPGGSRVRHR